MHAVNRRVFLLSAIALAAPSPARAQTAWPQRPVKFIVSLGPGSGVDLVARLFGDRLAVRWGKPVVVENKPGGDGVVAINAFIAAHDDHTFLFTPTGAFNAHPFVHEKMPYDPRELVPVARVTNTLVGVGVPSSLGISSLKEFVALVQAKPGELNWTGLAGGLDVAFSGFLASNRLEMKKVSYRDPVQGLNDVAEGRVQTYVTALAVMRPQIEGGRIKLIAIANHERAPSAPDVPTAVEAGYPDLAFDGLVGLFGPRDLSDDLRKRIAADIREIGADRTIIDRLGATGQLVRPGDATEFAASIERQRAQIAAAAKRTGLKPQ
jgi:tripartite-type tricarboxylate transporter receptor subunit TctC